MTNIRKTIFTLLLSACALCGRTQTLDELNRTIESCNQEIQRSEQLLAKNHSSTSATRSKLSLVSSNIRNRRQIVQSLDKQINILDKDISEKNGLVKELEQNLETLRRQYASMIVAAYRNYRTNSALAFLFASRDFNDATLRIEYMRRMNAARRKRAVLIDSLSAELRTQIDELDRKRSTVADSRQARGEELKKLSQDEKQYKSTLQSLQNDERKIRERILQNEKQRRAAQQQIDRIISASASGGKSKSEMQKDVVLTGKFDQNKGRLPMPVRPGVITDHFGEHAHPTQRGVMINNTGVDITSDRGSQVRCVFEGTVKSVSNIPGMKNVIIVSHGDYFTVYCNMVNINVKTGDKVKTSQVIGAISSSDDPSEYVLHFELWKQTSRLNPEPWLQK